MLDGTDPKLVVEDESELKELTVHDMSELFRLTDEMTAQYFRDPTSLSPVMQTVLLGFHAIKFTENLAREHRWIWGEVAPNIFTMNEVIDCYRDQVPFRDTQAIPQIEQLEILEQSFWTPNDWFTDFANNLCNRKTRIERALGHDIFITQQRLAHYTIRERDPEFASRLSKEDPIKRYGMWLSKADIDYAFANPDKFIYGQGDENAKD